MVNDRRRGFDGTIDRAALHTITRVLHGFLVRAIGYRNALYADRVTRGIHHDEHIFQTTVFLSDQKAGSTAVVAILQHRCRAGFDTQLVLNAHAMHIIARAQTAICVDHEFRHDKQADAFDAFGRTAHAREHQMHDVLGHVVLTIGDVNFGAEHFVSAIGLRLCARTYQRQIRTGLRLGQVHGAGPFAADQFVQVSDFQFIAPCGQQGFDRAVGQQRTERETQAGRIQHFNAGSANGFRQALTTAIDGVLQTLPAAFGILLIGLLEAGRCCYMTVFQTGGLFVAFPVEGSHHILVETRAFFQHGLCGF